MLTNSLRLVLPATIALVLIATPSLGSTPDTIELQGVVRDFRKTHPDFNVLAPTLGHVAGSVGLTLPADGRPVYDPETGFAVGTQWTNSGLLPIAPHMYRNPLGASLKLVDAPIISQGVVLDSWQPSLGPYGGANVGPAPSMELGATMPTVSVPNLGPSVGPADLKDTVTISSDLHCDSLSTKQGTTILIDGNITIVCDGDFEVSKGSAIELLPGATLSLYILGDLASVAQGSSINMNTWTPSRCLIYYLGTGLFEVSQNSSVCARLVAPTGKVELHQNDHFYGSIVAMSAQFDQTTGYHAEGSGIPAQDACGADLADIGGIATGPSAGEISSATTFDQWYREALGVSLAKPHAISLTRDTDTGVFEFSDNAFYPVDGLLFGNELDSHNNYFTYSVECTFEYTTCGQFLEIQGSDDIWVYIDERLALDLGGMEAGTSQIIEMDRLNLTDGFFYTVQVFYAHRQGTPSLTLRTNIELLSDTPVVQVTWPND